SSAKTCTTGAGRSKAPLNCSCARIGTAARGTSICISTRSGCGSKTCWIQTVRRQDMRSVRSLMAFSLAALAVGCASSGQLNVDGVTRLEQARAARPTDPAVARSLGIAYYKAGRFADARAQLDRATHLDSRDGTTALY